MRLLGFSVNMIIAVFGLGMAAFYFWMLKSWSDAGEFGPGMPTVIGVGLFALLWFTGAIRRVFAGFKLVAPPKRPVGEKVSAELDDEGPKQGAFDPDAALARYMAVREKNQPAAQPTQSPRGFGRRGLSSD